MLFSPEACNGLSPNTPSLGFEPMNDTSLAI